MKIEEKLVIEDDQVFVSSTGEQVKVKRLVMRGPSDMDFDKVWILHLADALDLLGGVPIKILTHLIKSRNADNLIIATHKRIAEDLGCDRVTVSKTITALYGAKAITKVSSGVYRLNPALIWRGSHDHRMRVLLEYHRDLPENALDNPAAEHALAAREVADAERTLAAARRRLESAQREAHPSPSPTPERHG